MRLNTLFTIFIILIFSISCGKTIIKLNNASPAPEITKADAAKKKKGKAEPEPVVIAPTTNAEIDFSSPDYKKRYASNFIGLQEYSKPVTPNKPQVFRSTWFTSKSEIEQHVNPVCANDVETVVLYADFIDSAIHFWVGGITSTRSVLIYCKK